MRSMDRLLHWGLAGVTAALLVFSCITPTASAVDNGTQIDEDSVNNVWFPYVTVQKNNYVHVGPPWGGYGAEVYYKIDATAPYDASEVNAIWNCSRIFYWDNSLSQYNSYWDVGGGTMKWQIYIHNTSEYDFTGADRLRLYVYGRNGVQADESTRYNRPTGEGTGDYLINTDVASPFTWDSGNGCFLIEVESGEMVVVNAIETAKALFEDPTYTKQAFPGSIRICHPDDYEFKATLRGEGMHRWRKTAGTSSSDFSTEWNMQAFGYEGICQDDYSAGTSKITLPYFCEWYDATNDQTLAEWASGIFCTNATESRETLTIKAFKRDLDGGGNPQQIGPTYSPSVDACETIFFSPSQFMTSEDWSQQTGYVTIEGTQPVAISWQMRFPKSASQIYSAGQGWRYTRTISNHFIPFYID